MALAPNQPPTKILILSTYTYTLFAVCLLHRHVGRYKLSQTHFLLPFLSILTLSLFLTHQPDPHTHTQSFLQSVYISNKPEHTNSLSHLCQLFSWFVQNSFITSFLLFSPSPLSLLHSLHPLPIQNFPYQCKESITWPQARLYKWRERQLYLWIKGDEGILFRHIM